MHQEVLCKLWRARGVIGVIDIAGLVVLVGRWPSVGPVSVGPSDIRF